MENELGLTADSTSPSPQALSPEGERESWCDVLCSSSFY